MKKRWPITSAIALTLTMGGVVAAPPHSIARAAHHAGGPVIPFYLLHGHPSLIVRNGPYTDCGGTETQYFDNLQWLYNSSTTFNEFITYAYTPACQVYFDTIGIQVVSGYLYLAKGPIVPYTAWVSPSNAGTPVYAYGSTVDTCPTNIAHPPSWTTFNLNTQVVNRGK
jgi:hypothetical protein